MTNGFSETTVAEITNAVSPSYNTHDFSDIEVDELDVPQQLATPISSGDQRNDNGHSDQSESSAAGSSSPSAVNYFLHQESKLQVAASRISDCMESSKQEHFTDQQRSINGDDMATVEHNVELVCSLSSSMSSSSGSLSTADNLAGADSATGNATTVSPPLSPIRFTEVAKESTTETIPVQQLPAVDSAPCA